jgi:hypothetical protein
MYLWIKKYLAISFQPNRTMPPSALNARINPDIQHSSVAKYYAFPLSIRVLRHRSLLVLHTKPRLVEMSLTPALGISETVKVKIEYIIADRQLSARKLQSWWPSQIHLNKPVLSVCELVSLRSQYRCLWAWFAPSLGELLGAATVNILLTKNQVF